jgi:Tfp pilus assembly protein PilN
MKFAILFLVALISIASFGQPAPGVPITPDPKTMTLQDRYVSMKKSSETFQDYKVIKEGILDGVWRVTLDSIKNQKAKFANANEVIAQLESEVATQKAAVAKIQASMETVVYDSTHISFFGINFTKSLFISLVLLIGVGLLVAIAAVTGKLKLMYTSMKEKIETVNLLSQEYEDYKKRALEKQVKLSRELQTERNKLMNFEPRGSSKSIL